MGPAHLKLFKHAPGRLGSTSRAHPSWPQTDQTAQAHVADEVGSIRAMPGACGWGLNLLRPPCVSFRDVELGTCEGGSYVASLRRSIVPKAAIAVAMIRREKTFVPPGTAQETAEGPDRMVRAGGVIETCSRRGGPIEERG